MTRCTSKPAAVRIFSRTPSAPASAGVTDGQRRRSRAMVRASVIACQVLVPQQLIDTGLGSGALINPLDDHGAGGGGAGLTILQRPGRQRPRHHYRVFRNFPDEGLSSVAIDDL